MNAAGDGSQLPGALRRLPQQCAVAPVHAVEKPRAITVFSKLFTLRKSFSRRQNTRFPAAQAQKRPIRAVHPQPGARLGSLAGKFRGKTLSPANQRRRHRPDPPHRRQILAPHLVRRPQRLGNGTDRLPLERHDLDARTGRPNDAQRRRHGTQRRPVPARKPGPQSFLLGTRLRPIPKHRSRHADLARGSRNHNTQIKR